MLGVSNRNGGDAFDSDVTFRHRAFWATPY